jgi:hypothetical protein
MYSKIVRLLRWTMDEDVVALIVVCIDVCINMYALRFIFTSQSKARAD